MTKVKKAQEEIVGFVVVIVLIAVISMVFLGFQLRQKPTASESKQVANLISTILDYTTDCTSNMPRHEPFKDLIKSCYNQETCSNGITACQYLQDTSNKVLTAALSDLQAEQPLKAYSFNISYSTSQFQFGSKAQADMIVVSKGTCKGTSIGYKELLPLEAGDVEITLKFCY